MDRRKFLIGAAAAAVSPLLPKVEVEIADGVYSGFEKIYDPDDYISFENGDFVGVDDFAEIVSKAMVRLKSQMEDNIYSSNKLLERLRG